MPARKCSRGLRCASLLGETIFCATLIDGRHYLPGQTGRRFSRNEERPSRKSAVPRMLAFSALARANASHQIVAGEWTAAESGERSIETAASVFVCGGNFGGGVFGAAVQEIVS